MSVSMRGQPGWYRPAKGNGTAAGRPASWPGCDSAFIAAPRLAEPEKRQYSRSLCAHAASTPRSATNGGATEAWPFATSANSPISTYGVALRETVSPKRAAAACATLMCGASMTSSRAPSSAAASAPGESVRGRHHLQRHAGLARRFPQAHHARGRHQRGAEHHDARRRLLRMRRCQQKPQRSPQHPEKEEEETRHFPPCAGTASAGT
jgi:hypothetical protein